MTGTGDRWEAFRIELPDDAADAVASFLLDEGASGIVTATWDAGREDAPPAGRARLEAYVRADQGDRVATALQAYLGELAAFDADWTAAHIERSAVEPVDWETQFRRHHRPTVVGDRLLIAPPWDVPHAGDRIVIVIEPGMAFGTGQHATTRTCLEEIEALVARRAVRSALDVGTGSGVLAAALRRLGVPRVVAVDVDPAVLPIARDVLSRNGAGDVRLAAASAHAIRGRFDLVVANLLADVLVHDARPLAATVAPGGSLVVSGILAEQVSRVAGAYPGWSVVATRADDPWRTLRLERAS